jgi:hypothetical protein
MASGQAPGARPPRGGDEEVDGSGDRDHPVGVLQALLVRERARNVNAANETGHDGAA